MASDATTPRETIPSPRSNAPSALRESANPSLIYSHDDMTSIIESLASGGKHLFYGPGGVGKTYEMMEVARRMKVRGMNVTIVALANEAAVRFGGKGIYRAFGLTVDKMTGKPRSKLDDLCNAVRRSNPNRRNDPHWDGREANAEEKKDYEYMKKYTLGAYDPANLTDVQIISLINIRSAKYKQLDCAEVFRALRTSIFVVEEAFMVGGSLFTLMDQQLRKYRESDESFGGAGVLLCGDALQIEPIKDKYIFDTDTWKTMNPRVHLFDTYRRFDLEDLPFLTFLRNARMGKITDDDHQLLLSRRRSLVTGDSKYRLCRTRDEADRTNKMEFDKLKGSQRYAIKAKDKFFRVVRQGSEELLTSLPDSFIPEAIRILGDIADGTDLQETTRVVKGARISITHNDRDREVYNGFIGTVTDVNYIAYSEIDAQVSGVKGTIDSVVVLFDRLFTHKYSELPEEYSIPIVGEKYTLTKKLDFGRVIEREVEVTSVSPNDRAFTSRDAITIAKINNVYTKGSYAVSRTQFPFVLCWGRTIHKAQGATLDEGVLVLSGRMSAGQAYTGCGRFRCLNDLVIEDDYQRKSFYANLRALEFDRQIQEKGRYEVETEEMTRGSEVVEDRDDSDRFNLDEADAELAAFLSQ